MGVEVVDGDDEADVDGFDDVDGEKGYQVADGEDEMNGKRVKMALIGTAQQHRHMRVAQALLA